LPNVETFAGFSIVMGRRQELRALQRLGLVRQSREAAVHTVLPIVSWLLNCSRREAAQVTQGQRQQPLTPLCRRQRWQQAKG
jgi:hypothetical protein